MYMYDCLLSEPTRDIHSDRHSVTDESLNQSYVHFIVKISEGTILCIH